jgi:hypothetical protein
MKTPQKNIYTQVYLIYNNANIKIREGQKSPFPFVEKKRPTLERGALFLFYGLACKRPK